MPTLGESLPAILAALADRYGRPSTVPLPEDRFAAILAAYLGRTLEPRKVQAALVALQEAGLLDPAALAAADLAEVADATKSAKVPLSPRVLKPLGRLARWVADRGVEELTDAPVSVLREELAALNGIGPASADAILLLALGRPSYPVDQATYRILTRHGWIDESANYEEARDVIEQAAHDDPATLAHLSSWLERLGRDFCRLRVAKCEYCPLQPFLPEGGPWEPD
ncbi:MAG: endonuclease III [Isosphaeraceae bacterium]|nr:endonuclease III [Isosphaeraceae bacterium]